MGIYGLKEEINELVNEFVSGEDMKSVTAEAAGLDQRCHGDILVHDDGIMIPLRSRRNFDYYGGLEYVDAEDVEVLGDYVYYSANSDRISNIVDSVMSAD